LGTFFPLYLIIALVGGILDLGEVPFASLLFFATAFPFDCPFFAAASGFAASSRRFALSDIRFLQQPPLLPLHGVSLSLLYVFLQPPPLLPHHGVVLLPLLAAFLQPPPLLPHYGVILLPLPDALLPLLDAFSQPPPFFLFLMLHFLTFCCCCQH
jgi:hypothetical protein